MTILLIIGLSFIAILLGVLAVYMSYAAIKASPGFELRRRLQRLAATGDEMLPSDLKIEILKDMTPLDRFLYKYGLVKKLDRLIESSGHKIAVKLFILITVISALSGFIIGMLPGRGMIFPVILVFVFGSAPLFYLLMKKNRRSQKFMEQFPDVLDMISRSLKAGHSFFSAVEMVGSEMSEPVAGLFKILYEEQRLGVSTRDALEHMTERMESIDLRFFVAAINIYSGMGGNLSEILERLAHTIRERLKIRRQVRVYSAQARFSGYVLAALPLAMALFLYLVMPDYLGELTDSKTGRYVIAFAVISQIAGFFVIRKIINIRI